MEKMMMKVIRVFFFSALMAGAASASYANELMKSPDGTLTVELQTGASGLGWTVSRNGSVVYTESNVCVNVGGKTLGATDRVKSIRQRSATETIRPTVPLKFKEMESSYNEATVNYGSYQLLLRVMNNAVAHRFVLAQKGEVKVADEQFLICPADGFTAHFQTAGSFNTSYEEPYQHKDVADWQREGSMATVPALLSDATDTQLLIGESDVDDYPRMFLHAANGGIAPVFPKAPLAWEPWGDRGERITQEADYIAKTSGRRALPWRFVVVTDSKGIIEQTVPIELARRSVLTDTEWIRPGKFSWEWWNGATPYGSDVHFKAGCNYDTYCYFADFAANYGIEYILLDEGWAKSTTDPFHGNDQLRLPELIDYCNTKGVKIALWLPWLTVHQHLDSLFQTYAEWGIPAVKIDFMDHADQWMVNFYKRVTAEAAKHHIIVDWHGSYTPAGLEQEYPNLVSYEGVRGLEQMSGCRPENTLFIPFIRNAVGPADFTPGGMTNMQPEVYRSERPNSAAMGTRAFQMALYVVLESGIQMLADNPTNYYQNDDCTRYIASVPTTWDETRALQAKVGEYLVVAKRKGVKWYVGAITNGTQRDIELSLDFLSSGPYRLTAFSDGSNADYQAMHYDKEEKSVTAATTLSLHLARNGGWAAVLSPDEEKTQAFGAEYIKMTADSTIPAGQSKRPPIEQRLFSSQVIDQKIEKVKQQLADNPYLAWMFENCFPNTLETTAHYSQLPNGDDDTFVYTGDIAAMWLRDSGAQVWPYVQFCNDDPALAKLIRGVILRQLKSINLDPYANAFYQDPAKVGEWQSDHTDMKPGIHERKYEIDSQCYPIRLAYEYWKVTGDASIFGEEWLKAVDNILAVFREQQHKEGTGRYRFRRNTDRQFDTVGWDGKGHPVKPVGLIASFFRPSDDATVFPFLVPSNFIAVTSLRKAAEILNTVNNKADKAAQCNALADEVEQALKKYAIVDHPKYGKIYAFEVDGYGSHLLMDDANVPSLLAMAYLGDVPLNDPIYQNTRRFVWSTDNPSFFRGKAGEGIGGPHIGYDMPWPMSIMMYAFTSQDDDEIRHCIEMLMRTDAGTGFIHESFHKDDALSYSRPWFAWQNTLFGELILKLIADGKAGLLNSCRR